MSFIGRGQVRWTWSANNANNNKNILKSKQNSRNMHTILKKIKRNKKEMLWVVIYGNQKSETIWFLQRFVGVIHTSGAP